MAGLIATASAAVKAASLSTILSVAGSAVGGLGAIQSGKAQQASSEYQAAQLEAAAKTERATAQREAKEERRQASLLQSRARAVGANSGGGIDFELAGDIEADGEYRALTALWEGEEAAKGREAQAAASRFEGRQAKRAGLLRAGGTILGGAGRSFLEKYG